ncbi:MAG TPA: hypothetical protein VNU71_17265, partial [Burkholderiaceae bacterium]|nr:hypothetical protein [Burkholderiaceae bacterium]
MQTPPLADAEPPNAAARAIGRLFFGTAAAAALASALILWSVPTALAAPARPWLVGAIAALAALCALLMRAGAGPRLPLNAALFAVATL